MAALPQLISGSTDEALAERVARGEDDAFEELYRRYARALASYGARLVGDRTAGEDIAQTAMLKAYQAIRRGHGPVRVRAWLYGIAQNTSYDVIRRRRDVVTADVEEISEAAAPDPSDRTALLAAVRELPERQRDVYLLREFKGQSIPEIATRLDLAVEQVEQALFAARNRLAEHLAFGGRLTCADVRRAHGSALDSIEKRAFKSHVRKCASCRAAGIGRGPAFGIGGLLDGLRQIFQPLLAGGGGIIPVVASKAGAVVIAAAVAGGSAFGAHAVIGSAASATAASADIGSPPSRGSAGDLAGVMAASSIAPSFLRVGAPTKLSAAPAAVPGNPAAPAGTGPAGPTVPTDGAAPVPVDGGGSSTDSDPSAEVGTQDSTATQGGNSTDPSLTDTTPADTTPADATPADTIATDTTPTDATPVDAPPPDQPPVDTVPADPTAPADPAPTP